MSSKASGHGGFPPGSEGNEGDIQRFSGLEEVLHVNAERCLVFGLPAPVFSSAASTCLENSPFHPGFSTAR